MPFIHVRHAGAAPDAGAVAILQKGITALMADVLGKTGPLVGVLVESVPAAGWSLGGEPVARAAQVDAIISAGSNTPDEKARFIAETFRLLRSALGPDLSEVSYVVLHEVPKDSWGYGGLTQAHRAEHRLAEAGR